MMAFVRGFAFCLVAVLAVSLVGCGAQTIDADSSDLDSPETLKGIEDGTISNPVGAPLGQERFRQQMEGEKGQTFTGDTESGQDAGGDGSSQ